MSFPAIILDTDLISSIVSQARREALEEAAKVAEQEFVGSGWHPASRNASIAIAEAIRSLQSNK